MEPKRPSVELEIAGTDASGTTILELIESTEAQHSEQAAPEAEAVPDRLELVARREIVLRCGNASITLTRAGKIILRGTYVLSRSSGVNKIKGGSVQIN